MIKDLFTYVLDRLCSSVLLGCTAQKGYIQLVHDKNQRHPCKKHFHSIKENCTFLVVYLNQKENNL